MPRAAPRRHRARVARRAVEIAQDLGRGLDAHVGTQEPRLQILEHGGIDLATAQQSAQVARHRGPAAVQARLEARKESLRFCSVSGIAGDCLMARTGWQGLGYSSGHGIKRSGRGRQERDLRIIAGQWRGREFRFPPGDIRPTPDRVRETLFNWLQTRIEGATAWISTPDRAHWASKRSRAVRRRWCSSSSSSACRVAADAAARLAAAGAQVVCTEAAVSALPEGGELSSLGAGRPRFDLVFLDPPYASAELARSAAALQAGWLAPKRISTWSTPVSSLCRRCLLNGENCVRCGR